MPFDAVPPVSEYICCREGTEEYAKIVDVGMNWCHCASLRYRHDIGQSSLDHKSQGLGMPVLSPFCQPRDSD